VCVAVRCGVLQFVVVCCSVLRCVAVCCSALQSMYEVSRLTKGRVCCSVLQCVAMCCSALQSMYEVSRLTEGRVCCSVLRCVAVCCSALQSMYEVSRLTKGRVNIYVCDEPSMTHSWDLIWRRDSFCTQCVFMCACGYIQTKGVCKRSISIVRYIKNHERECVYVCVWVYTERGCV